MTFLPTLPIDIFGIVLTETFCMFLFIPGILILLLSFFHLLFFIDFRRTIRHIQHIDNLEEYFKKNKDFEEHFVTMIQLKSSFPPLIMQKFRMNIGTFIFILNSITLFNVFPLLSILSLILSVLLIWIKSVTQTVVKEIHE